VRGARWLLLLLPLGAAVWALMPLYAPVIEAGGIEAPKPKAEPIALVSLDSEAFRAPLWVAPPPLPPPAPPAPPPPPLRLQLLAVVHEDGVYKAMLYDPDADKILVAAAGDSPAGKKVEQVTANSVKIRDATGVRTLALKEGATP
jgi:hypothetical protein